MERTIGCGPISAERALNYGFTGPNLRAAGVDYDVRYIRRSQLRGFRFRRSVGTTGDLLTVSWCGTKKCTAEPQHH